MKTLSDSYLLWACLPDCYLSAEGFVLLLDVNMSRLQTHGFPGLHLLDAAIAYGTLAFLQFVRQPAARAFYWVVTA